MNDQGLISELQSRIVQLEVLNNQFKVVSIECTLGWVDPELVSTTRPKPGFNYIAITETGSGALQLSVGVSPDAQVFLLGAVYFQTMPHCLVKTHVEAAGHSYFNFVDTGELGMTHFYSSIRYDTNQTGTSIPIGYRMTENGYVRTWLNVDIVNRTLQTSFTVEPTHEFTTKLTLPLWLQTFSYDTM